MKENILKEIKIKPQTFKDLKEKLNIRSGYFLNENLKELREDEKIYYRKSTETYHIKDEEIKVGEFKETRHDFGFVDLPEGVSIFIPGRFTNGSLDGDLVKISLFPKKEDEDPNRRAGKVSKIIERNKGNIVGRYKKVDEELKFIPDDYNSNKEFLLDNYENVNEGDIIVGKFKTYKNNVVTLSVIENLGKENNAKIDYLVIAKRNNLPLSFSEEVLKEANNLSHEISSKDREDMSNEMVVTIDGETSKDLDDAVSVFKNKKGNFELKVHIADVAHYVQTNTLMDDEAFKRGTSTYLIDHVIPMLPKIISNDLASLNPDTKKYTLSAIMEIDSVSSEILKFDIKETVIKSKYKLTYPEVDDFLLGKSNSVRDDEELSKMIVHSKELATILRKRKLKNGMIDFVLPETKFTLNENGLPIKIEEKYQTESEKIIEDLMVVTNEEVAKFLERKELPGIYRTHGKPTEEKLTSFFEMSKVFGEFINKPIKDIESSDLAKFVSDIEDKSYGDILKKFMIQSMEKAIYSPENNGHYALGLKKYLHFTSPIRRYPDLITHRIIKDYYINNKKYENEKEEYLLYATKWLSDRERIAMVAERKLSDVKKARYMEKSIDEDFVGRIVTVTNFGFFVDLKNQIQGLVRIEDLTDDEYYHDPIKFALIGKNNNKSYKLGDKIKVTISGYDFIKGVVDIKVK